MVMSAIIPESDAIIFPMDETEAREITNEIRAHLEHLANARDKILKVYRGEGWKALGYSSFSEYGQTEFGKSFQQIYNLRAAAEFDEELNLYSPEGEKYEIPVNHAKQLRKLKKPESRVRAYQMAQAKAEAQGKDMPTEKIIEEIVYTVKDEETVFQSPYTVVRNKLASSEITASQAKQITLELDRLGDVHAQAYVQGMLIGNFGLTHPELIYPLGCKFIYERQRGKPSTVLDGIERTNGYLAGTHLSKATPSDLKRANAEGHAEHRSVGIELKQQRQMAAGEPIEEQFALTLWKNGPIRSAKELIRLLPPNDLEAVFELLAQYLGYTPTEAYAQVLEDQDLIEVDYTLHQAGSFEAIEEGQDLQVLTRVKPKEEKKGEDDGTKNG